ncbi:hypothetical protein [Lelliottia wanjuensis]|uniref:hypothetical protein n=1 Tax=Lelliottia wanjuensis TaxID=3050585 RepID=UPI00254D2D92|nr:hypothetical protein [Lelliottia sp. V86_10]MDK9585798.1 hypothetical protein [Lelliottia sp. V86_10]
MTNNKLTDGERISNATLIRLILWADEHKSHYVAAALRELQEYRNAQQVVPSKPTESDIPSWLNGEKRLHWLSGAEWMHNTFCAAMQSGAVKDGWVMVPEEPTHEMLEAGDEQFGTYDVYRRMLAAAPQQEAE